MKVDAREKTHLLTIGALIHVCTQLVSDLDVEPSKVRRTDIEHKVTTSLNKRLSQYMARGED